ncbi:FAD-dependent oxidoreductase [Galbitalea sp. SE-J8]|uniref:FAD-dependent oxidoreductase n=1 Tax=Galbitalea sp. SE-J8 TaxID=3054952 RepID=UPI00259CF807|nr:FAD-dependent oxidoreductase [Galbitalea sp. SE-J8]MDM4762970.1 FAD-dependent oxidoreductase [Galbitalea sp. SE-J8]
MISTDVVVVGGGFYGLRIALHLREEFGAPHVTILERETALMARASLVNQARVHNGYHYPRSILTAFRSRVNFPRFLAEYRDAVVDDFEHYYAIASRLSKVTAKQFELFCARIGAEHEQASERVTDLFRPDMIDGVYAVREYGFDASRLRELLVQRLDDVGGVDVVTGVEATRVSADEGGIRVDTTADTYRARRVVNATYAGINRVNALSGLPLFDLQHETTEMALVRMPEPLRSTAFTVMDGPFFSIMPYPTRGLHTLSHVRYTPHRRWRELASDGAEGVRASDTRPPAPETSTFTRMRADVARFLPVLSELQRADSVFEVKTVPVRSDENDSRPILYRSDLGLDGYSCVLGGKLDNIYDVFRELDRDYS